MWLGSAHMTELVQGAGPIVAASAPAAADALSDCAVEHLHFAPGVQEDTGADGDA
jgi:hypothetical protein